MTNEQKLERSIMIAKQILKENPDDTWVEKGLIEMEKELKRLKGLSDERRTNIE